MVVAKIAFRQSSASVCQIDFAIFVCIALALLLMVEESMAIDC